MQQYPFLYSIHYPFTFYFLNVSLELFFTSVIHFINSCKKKLYILRLEVGYLLGVCHLLSLNYNYKCKYSC